jgi:hypothetical protein
VVSRRRVFGSRGQEAWKPLLFFERENPVSDTRLIHDSAWAAAEYMARRWKALIATEEGQAAFFAEQYQAIKAAIEAFALHKERQTRRLLGGGRN